MIKMTLFMMEKMMLILIVMMMMSTMMMMMMMMMMLSQVVPSPQRSEGNAHHAEAHLSRNCTWSVSRDRSYIHTCVNWPIATLTQV